MEAGEDVTVYGEFVSSYFAWLPPEKQKQRAKNWIKRLKSLVKANRKGGCV